MRVEERAVAALHTQPWAQQRLDFTRVWKLTRGNGITVAVVDSGVDVTQPQLAGHVSSVDLTHTMTRDCVGHGTAVAGMRERVAAYGGALSAGPRPGGGFTVGAEFPLERSAGAAVPLGTAAEAAR